jgi:N-acetylglucosamine-6-sulfatase
LTEPLSRERADGSRGIVSAAPAFASPTILFAVAVAAIGVAVTLGAQDKTRTQMSDLPLNVVFVIADDLDAGLLNRMPTLQQQIQRQGPTFKNYRLSDPLCCPTRATIFRGQHAHNTKIWGNSPPTGGHDKFVNLGLDKRTIFTMFNNHAYRTALIGKWLNSFNHPHRTNNETDEDLPYHPPGVDTEFIRLNESSSPIFMRQDGSIYERARTENETELLTDEAIRFIEDGEGAKDMQPFFLYFAPTAPHKGDKPLPHYENTMAQLPRPASFNEDDMSGKPDWISDNKKFCTQGQLDNHTASWVQDNCYFKHGAPKTIASLKDEYRQRVGSVRSLDSQIARLMTTLQQTGELSGTYVIFTSDNGYLMGEHRHYEKRVPYEEAVNVPLIVSGPGVEQGAVKSHPVQDTDFYPTFARIVGATPPAFVDGRSFRGALRAPSNGGISAADWPRDIQLIEGGANLGASPPEYHGIVKRDNEKFVIWPTSSDEEYYDLTNDPNELAGGTRSLTSARLQTLRDRTRALAKCSGASCRAADHY